jgi:hypothetical protein
LLQELVVLETQLQLELLLEQLGQYLDILLEELVEAVSPQQLLELQELE